MDPVAQIVTALTSGSVVRAEGTESDAMRNADNALRMAVLRRLSGRAAAEIILEKYDRSPSRWAGALAAELTAAGAGSDKSILAATRRMIELGDRSGSGTGEYFVDLRGVQGGQVGDRNMQKNTFKPMVAMIADVFAEVTQPLPVQGQVGGGDRKMFGRRKPESRPVDLKRAQGVVVGSGSQYNYFGTKSIRNLLIAGVVLALVVTGLVLYRAIPSVPHPSLRLVNVAVQKPSKVAATLGDASGAEAPTAGTTDTTVVDVTVENDGNAPAVIVKADFVASFAEQLQDCLGTGGELLVSANYSIVIPEKPPTTPFTISRDLRFEVPSGAAQRLSFTIGPEHFHGSSWISGLFAGHLVLHDSDAGDPPLDVGGVGVSAPAGKGLESLATFTQYSADVSKDCVAGNEALVKRMLEIPVARSDEVAALDRGYSALLGADAVGTEQDSTSATSASVVGPNPSETEVARLAPVNAAGRLDSGFRVTGDANEVDCSSGSDVLGDNAYRCGTWTRAGKSQT